MGKMWKQVLRCSLWSLDAGHDGGSIIFSWNFSDLPVWHCIKMVCTGRVHKLSGEYDRIFSIFTVPGNFDRFTENSDDCTLLRNSMLTEMKLDYVRTAYSKGCSKNQVMFGHVLKNAMMPVITFLGMMIAEILAGSIVVEQVFALPGIGRLLISSVGTRDLPVVEILILYITFVVIFVYFIVDILYRVIDPRIRKSE